MKYLLDSNICIALLNRTDTKLTQQFIRHQKEDIFLCSIVKAEIIFAAKKSSRRSQNEEALKRFFREFKSLSFDDQCAEHYGSLRTSLEEVGTPIGSNDLFIASIALRNNLCLVTKNTKEFERIRTLSLEQW